MTAVAEDFREVMAGVPTPVSVVTTLTDGHPHGTTVSAFASLSMTPPMVLVSIAAINVWNRLNAATRQPAGSAW